MIMPIKKKRRSLKFRDYFLTGEVAELLDIDDETVKKWEKLGIIPKAQRDPETNYRLFDKEKIHQYIMKQDIQ